MNSKRHNGIDRISNLPDELLSHILSFLPTKCVVATSNLSTRWKFLWTFITNFDLTCPHSLQDIVSRKIINSTLYINRLLLLHNPYSFHKFRLKSCKFCFDPSYLNSSSISRGSVSFDIRELDLSIILSKVCVELPLSSISFTISVLKLCGNIRFQIPEATSLCFPSLQALQLSYTKFEIPLDSSISLPYLKIMELTCVKYATEESMLKLLSSSSIPVLDHLTIKRDICDEINCLILHIPSLTRLSIEFDTGGLSQMSKLQIDCPALHYLNLQDPLPCQYLHLENVSSLLEANVRLFFYYNHDVNEESCTSITQFIGSLTNVNLLSASGHVLQAFRISSSDIASSFRNLTRLEIEVYDCLDLSVLIHKFLGSMDNLQHLVIKGCQECKSYCFSQPWWTEPLNVPRCLLSRVTSVSFGCVIVGCCDQLELLKYFLRNAEALQLLTIGTDHIPEGKKLELREEISFMPRVSRKCQVVFT